MIQAAFERLLSWVAEEGARPPRFAFALGLLTVILVDREIADYMVRSSLAQTLLSRLRTPPLSDFLFGGSEGKAKAAASLSFDPLPGMTHEELLGMEVRNTLSCLALMGEYQVSSSSSSSSSSNSDTKRVDP